MSTIICGSKKYENLSFDRLVDSFDIIVRSNMLLPNNNYGKRNSNYQVLNCHMDNHRTKGASLSQWISTYAETVLEDQIGFFYEYLKLKTVKFVHFTGNNTELMRSILRKHNIDHKINRELRCGFAYIAECINKEIKPSIVGFSLKEGDTINKQFSNKQYRLHNPCHDTHSEIRLLKKLHEANLIYATFCIIEDTQDIKIDSSLLTPTNRSLEILNKFYPKGANNE